MELQLRVMPEVTLDLGGRLDFWLMGGHQEGAIDPRARITWNPIDELALHAGAGVARMPPTFFVTAAGTTDLPLAAGLQTAIQTELGASLDVGWLHAEVNGFFQRFEDLAFSDFATIFGSTSACGELADGQSCPVVATPPPRTNGLSYGAEVFAAVAQAEPLSGWVSYTLSWSETDPISGVPFRPSYDVRHVLNVVARWEPIAGLTIGGRAHVRSGQPRGVFYVDQFPYPRLRRHDVELPVSPTRAPRWTE